MRSNWGAPGGGGLEAAFRVCPHASPNPGPESDIQPDASSYAAIEPSVRIVKTRPPSDALKEPTVAGTDPLPAVSQAVFHEGVSRRQRENFRLTLGIQTGVPKAGVILTGLPG